MKTHWRVPTGDIATLKAVKDEWENKAHTVLSYVREFSTVVQAGGNLGVFPYYLSEVFERVITFEPIPHIWDCLLDNLRGIPNIEKHNKALGASSQLAKIKEVFTGNCGATSINYSPLGDIVVVAIDDLNLDKLDLLWLDVEGFEVEALKGAADSIEKYSPVIVVENKGLIPNMGGDLNGSQTLVDWMHSELKYKKVNRLMRDDVFIRET